MARWSSKLMLTLICGLTSISSLAGTWSGMGGELLGDSLNPWFVRREFLQKELIPYCVEIDEQHFGVDERTVRNLVRDELTYWFREFAAAYSTQVTPEFYVGLDTFAEQTCTDTTPLRFQFGYLSDEQKEKLDELKWDVTQHVGLTIRTDYDQNLRGRGFIYISPTSGPLAMKGDDIRPNPWNDERNLSLRLVLRHELGHIFGLRHEGHAQYLMSQEFPEYVVSSDFKGFYSELPFFRHSYQGSFYYCGQASQNFFQVSDAYCFGLKSSAGGVDVYSQTSGEESLLVGRIEVLEHLRSTFEEKIWLWLPEGNTFFPGFAGGSRRLSGPLAEVIRWQGVYRNIDGTISRPVAVESGPGRFYLGGLLDGRVFRDLNEL